MDKYNDRFAVINDISAINLVKPYKRERYDLASIRWVEVCIHTQIHTAVVDFLRAVNYSASTFG